MFHVGSWHSFSYALANSRCVFPTFLEPTIGGRRGTTGSPAGQKPPCTVPCGSFAAQAIQLTRANNAEGLLAIFPRHPQTALATGAHRCFAHMSFASVSVSGHPMRLVQAALSGNRLTKADASGKSEHLCLRVFPARNVPNRPGSAGALTPLPIIQLFRLCVVGLYPGLLG